MGDRGILFRDSFLSCEKQPRTPCKYNVTTFWFISVIYIVENLIAHVVGMLESLMHKNIFNIKNLRVVYSVRKKISTKTLG